MFDKAYAEGVIDHVFATNLTYTPKEVLERPWFSQADMSKYMAFVIATLNHYSVLSYLLNPWNRIEKLLTKHRRRSSRRGLRDSPHTRINENPASASRRCGFFVAPIIEQADACTKRGRAMRAPTGTAA